MINRNWLQVKRAIFKSAREVYVLADSSKFGVGYVSVICPANLLKDLGKKSGEIEIIREVKYFRIDTRLIRKKSILSVYYYQ